MDLDNNNFGILTTGIAVAIILYLSKLVYGRLYASKSKVKAKTYASSEEEPVPTPDPLYITPDQVKTRDDRPCMETF